MGAKQAAQKIRTAYSTVALALGLVLLKVATYIYTRSSGVLGSAVDSLLDVLASLLVVWAVVAAARPADADHPWGHGKAEGLASLFQSFFILASGGGLILQVVRRFADEKAVLEHHWAGIAVMVVSTALTLWWVSRLRVAARETGSPALAADSAHYASDVALNGSVILGLALSTLLDGAKWPDLVVGLGIGLLILNTARHVFLRAIENLMDRGLEPQEGAAILRAVARFAPRVAGFHDLRTRRSGSEIFLELHLELDRNLSFVEAHDLGEQVAQAVERELPRSRATIHADPL